MKFSAKEHFLQQQHTACPQDPGQEEDLCGAATFLMAGLSYSLIHSHCIYHFYSFYCQLFHLVGSQGVKMLHERKLRLFILHSYQHSHPSFNIIGGERERELILMFQCTCVYSEESWEIIQRAKSKQMQKKGSHKIQPKRLPEEHSDASIEQGSIETSWQLRWLRRSAASWQWSRSGRRCWQTRWAACWGHTHPPWSWWRPPGSGGQRHPPAVMARPRHPGEECSRAKLLYSAHCI